MFGLMFAGVESVNSFSSIYSFCEKVRPQRHYIATKVPNVPQNASPRRPRRTLLLQPRYPPRCTSPHRPRHCLRRCLSYPNQAVIQAELFKIARKCGLDEKGDEVFPMMDQQYFASYAGESRCWAGRQVGHMWATGAKCDTVRHRRNLFPTFPTRVALFFCGSCTFALTPPHLSRDDVQPVLSSCGEDRQRACWLWQDEDY
mmetsp:Transcript_75895/g.216454  ORF Transcript_75895/g.216454 Transcript_75895/m.216454 type:complete len:201 (+) Transcript_75895:645-1247(+)